VQLGHIDGGHFHFDTDGGHGDFGHGQGGAGHDVAAELSKFNFGTITAFLAWFGGAGYLLRRYTGLWTVFGLAAAALMGLAGAAIVFSLLSKLVGRDRTLRAIDFDMIGVLGRVSSPVREGGTGEMIFSQDGVRKAAPARSEDGQAIARGEEVVVTRYENGIAYVRRWDELAG
jgi:membrane protein implicated in regulation of membrane protease activity